MVVVDITIEFSRLGSLNEMMCVVRLILIIYIIVRLGISSGN